MADSDVGGPLEGFVVEDDWVLESGRQRIRARRMRREVLLLCFLS